MELLLTLQCWVCAQKPSNSTQQTPQENALRIQEQTRALILFQSRSPWEMLPLRGASDWLCCFV